VDALIPPAFMIVRLAGSMMGSVMGSVKGSRLGTMMRRLG
jgi:hypothetical protein